MDKKINFKPTGYSTLTPYLIVEQGKEAIEFYKKVFGASEEVRMERPDNKIGHAELKIGDSKFMLADECPERATHSAKTIGNSPIGLHLYVEDVDAITNKAVSHGAKLVQKVEDQFYGDRTGTIEDPFGHIWHIATHVEEVTEEEMEKRVKKIFGG